MVRGLAAARLFGHFFRDPIGAARRNYELRGPFVAVEVPLGSRNKRKLIVVAAGPAFNEAVLSDPATWRHGSATPGGSRNSPARRASRGILRLSGSEHEHARRLLLPPLRRKSIDAQGVRMAELAEEAVASWPVNEPIDLVLRTNHLYRALGIGILFGDERRLGYPTVELVDHGVGYNWSLGVAAFPFDLPGTPYARMQRGAAALERKIIEWAGQVRGRLDPGNLLSIMANSPDHEGKPASDALIVGQLPSLLAAVSETGGNVLIWTLVLLDQHPRIARDLLDELQGRLKGAPPTLERIADLPLLDAVVKESMRIMPPVPQQFRVATRDTTLSGFPVRRGTRVVLSGFLTNRMPDLYPEGDRFRPERWAKLAPSPYEFSAFGAGPRGCPGFWFGETAVKVALAAVLTRFRVALAPGTRIDYKLGIAMGPRRPIPAMLHRQDGAFAAAPIRGAFRNLVRLPH